MDSECDTVYSRKRQRVRRSRGRPPRVSPKPNVTGLPALPAEIIGRIASFLIPQPADSEIGFTAPNALPYGGKHGITQQNKLSAHGGVPSGVRDVLRLAQTCRQCDRGVSLAVGKIGNAATDDKKRTLYITLPHDTSGWLSLSAREDVDNSPSFHLMSRVKASSTTLEHMVISGCPHKIGNRSAPGDSALHNLRPFQKDDITFPALKHLQVGPDLCPDCTRSVMRLFCANKFYEEKEYRAGGDDPKSAFTYMHNKVQTRRGWGANTRGERSEQFEGPATPNLTSLLLHVDNGDRRWQLRGYGQDVEGIDAILREIGQPEKIEMLQVWLQDNPVWGGMGPTGSVDKVACKVRNTIEAEMTAWAENELDKGKTAQERLLAKFQAQAKLAMPKTSKKTDTTARDKADESKDDTPGSEESETQLASASSSTDGAKPRIKREHSDNGSSAEADDSDNDDRANAPPHAASANTTNTGAARPPRTSRPHHRMRPLVHCDYEHILRQIALKLPNLVGLSVLRSGVTRYDVTETKSNLTDTAAVLVEPLSSLSQLRYLDLGLAIASRAEVADFPLGLSIGTSRAGKAKGREVESALQALKRRHYTLAATKAKKEGDDWRKQVVERFVDTSHPLARSMSSTPAGETTSDDTGVTLDDHDDNDSTDDNERLAKWPKSVRSGHVFAPDLTNRLRGNGLLISWKVEGGTIVFEEPIGTRL